MDDLVRRSHSSKSYNTNTVADMEKRKRSRDMGLSRGGDLIRSGSIPRFGNPANYTDESKGENEVDMDFGNLVRESQK